MKKNISLPKFYPVSCHTDNIGLNSTFVAINGMRYSGIDFISKAINQGATKVVIQANAVLNQEISELIKQKKIEVIYVDNTRKALSELSAKALDCPSKNLKIIGVTGTKGKTTTVYLLEHILKTAGFKTALISSAKNKILDQEFSSNLTTPQPDYLHVFFDICKKANVEYVIMEVAAQAVSLYRINNIEFNGVIFTNFSLEHSEFYSSIDNYFNAKVNLFKKLKINSPAILNIDDKFIKKLITEEQKNIITFGADKNADITGSVDFSDINSLLVSISFKDFNYKFTSNNLIGQFNLYNILAVVAFAQTLNINILVIQEAISTFLGVPGRLNKYNLKNGAIAFIDYAHTVSSFEAVFNTLRFLTQDLIVVFGAGGDRDKIKRPLMGQVASKYADKIFLTTDNPRSEDPKAIIKDILNGIPENKLNNIFIVLNRELAIKKAVSLSKSKSIIALLGKGPDEYQIINNTKTYFSEAQILANLIL